MPHDLQHYVCRAADEFRAADRAESPEAAEAHRLLALEFVHLVKCDGNLPAYSFLRRRRERAAGAALTVPLSALTDAA